MYLDALNRVATAQAVTTTAVSTDSIDLGNPTPKNEIGSGEPMAALFTLTAAADAADTNETYIGEVITSTAGNLGSSVVVVGSVTIPRGSAIGSRFVVVIPPGSVTQRYLGARVTTGGTTPSVGVTIDFAPLSFLEKRNIVASGFLVS